MDAGAERAAVARPAWDEREPGAEPLCHRQGDVGREGMLGEAVSGQDDAVRPRVRERRRGTRLERSLGAVAVVDPLEHVGLVLGQAEAVLGDVPEPGPPWVDDEDLRAASRGLADPQVQDRDLLLGVEADHEDRLRALEVGVRRRERGCRRDRLGPAAE